MLYNILQNIFSIHIPGIQKTFLIILILTLSHIWDSIVDFFGHLKRIECMYRIFNRIILLIQFDFKFNKDLHEQNTVLITITCN